MSAQSPQQPALPEASTVTPKTVIAVGTMLPAVATIAVALRFYVRIVRTKSVGFDDFLILFALVLPAWTSCQPIIDLMSCIRFSPSL